MPYPRRLIIYLREKGIDSNLVKVVHVSDPQLGNKAPPKFPPRPAGSLPILAIPSMDDKGTISYTHIRQSLAIMNFLDELCDAGLYGFPKSKYSMHGTDALERARNTEVLTLADECTSAWNPVRTFGTGAGSMAIPEASKEMIRWIYRPLATIEGWWKDRDFANLRQGSETGPVMAEIILYQFLEFVNDCYRKDLTKGSGNTVKDVYGREVVEKYEKLNEFYIAFKKRKSARRDEEAGEVPGKAVLKKMSTWNWDESQI
jgi:glutathione S-transferase